ncbi:MAG: right-handed parallel beta-helix repeat-containing protein [Clostridia bacterium]|nr:right-handed parallel beta-helix repeat-containing protein [Clostridia bacterium]
MHGKCFGKRRLSFICAFFLLITLLLSALPSVSAVGGNVYHVSVDGTGTGLTSADPMSFSQANQTTFKGGDTILFKRGDTFYGSFVVKAKGTTPGNRVEIGAYGEGELPTISNAKIISSAWTVSEIEGFYEFNLVTGTYGGVQNDNANVGFMEDQNGVKHGIRQRDAESCVNPFDFFCDDTDADGKDDTVFVKTDIDPYEAFGELRLATHAQSALRVQSNMIVHDIRIADSGYGITRGVSMPSNIRIYDCLIENIGGIELSDNEEEGFVKAGNGIEFYDGASNILVETCIFRDIYDVAFTCQGHNGSWLDITVRNNVFVNNTQAIEFWMGNTAEDMGLHNFVFTDNVCINQGEGWGTDARPAKHVATDFLAYGITSPVWDVNMSGNRFYHSGTQGASFVLYTPSVDPYIAQANSDYNHFYYPSADAVFARWSKQYAHTFFEWQTRTGTEQNSTYTVIDPTNATLCAMEQTAETSDDFGAILLSANAALPVSAQSASVNVLSADAVADGTQNIQAYKIPIDSSTDLWSTTYPHEYTSTPETMWTPTAFEPGTVDGITDVRANGLAYGFGAANVTTRRAALLVDIGSVHNVDSVVLHMVSDTTRIFDCTVYASNSNTLTTLYSRENLVGHFVSENADLKTTIPLTGATNVRYLFITFNKMGSDPNSPTGFKSADGRIDLAEVEVYASDRQNLLSGITASQFSVHSVENTDKLVWDDTYNYGAVSSLQHYGNQFPTTLSDGDVTTLAYESGYGHVWDADGVASRRLAFCFDLGGLYRLDEIVATVSSLDYTVYDYTVFASAAESDAAKLLNDAYHIGHYRSREQNIESGVSLYNTGYVRYVLIVFNKLANDVGNANTATSGQYGYDPLMGPAFGTGGGLFLTELEIMGEAKPVTTPLLSVNELLAGTQTVHYLRIENPNYSTLWTNTYPYKYGNVLTDYLLNDATALADGATNGVLGNNGYGGLFAEGVSNPTYTASRRVAVQLDLGAIYDLYDLTFGISGLAQSVYDVSVYASVTDVGTKAMLSEGNLVGRYSTDQRQRSVTVPLFGATRARYVLVVFNKVGTDPGNADDAVGNQNGFDENGDPLFGATTLAGSAHTSGGIHLNELNVLGIASVPSVNAPSVNGATILVDPTDGYDMKFISTLPTDLSYTGYTLKEYGTLVIPQQYLPFGSNPKDGAELVYGNPYTARSAFSVKTNGQPSEGAVVDAVLSGSSQGIYPGVKFAARPYLLYENGAGDRQLIYGNVCVRSVWSVARTIAVQLLTARDNNGLSLVYTDKVTAAYTVEEAEVATSTTAVTLNDLYTFITANVANVSLIANEGGE